MCDKNSGKGVLLSITSSVLYAVNLIMVSTLLSYFNFSAVDETAGDVMSSITTFALPLTLISCGLSIVTDGIIIIGQNSCRWQDLEVEQGKKREIRNNLILSSVLYCFNAVVYLYVARKLGASIQSAVDSLQVIFLILFHCRAQKTGDHRYSSTTKVCIGILVYCVGIYFMSFVGASNTPGALDTVGAPGVEPSLSKISFLLMLTMSSAVVLLMTYNGILFERATKIIPVIDYLFLQSILCFVILAILCGFYDSGVSNVFNRKLFLYALTRHVVGIGATYSEAFAIKIIGYQKFIMIQTIIYPLASFLLHCILVNATTKWPTLVGLTLISGGLFFLQWSTTPDSSVGEEGIPLIVDKDLMFTPRGKAIS